jgi:cell division protein FtsB
MNKTPPKLIFSIRILLGFFLAMGLFTIFIIFYFPDYARLRKIREANTKILSQIQGLSKEIKNLDSNNSRISKDPALYEKLAREKLGVAKDSEIVIDIKE